MVQCADGFTVSIQAGSTYYCEPRSNAVNVYESVEVGFPNRPCMLSRTTRKIPEI